MLKDRTQAGILLSSKLEEYSLQKPIIYGIPRGGVIVALQIAKRLNAPLDIVITRKVSHPLSSEYAIGAVTESNLFLANKEAIGSVDEEWLESEIDRKHKEALDRRKLLGPNIKKLSPKGRVCILVDDGVATGLTLEAAIKELKTQKPKIIVAVPLIASSVARKIKKDVDDLISILTPAEDTFLGAVGMYYENFDEVTNDQIINIIKNWKEADSKIQL